ncbi:hypothetical protein JXO59_05485 [candidate division KSB1 bacterium]|nr:hypothetical protein [candidate division KSB1 bacterium]
MTHPTCRCAGCPQPTGGGDYCAGAGTLDHQRPVMILPVGESHHVIAAVTDVPLQP